MIVLKLVRVTYVDDYSDDDSGDEDGDNDGDADDGDDDVSYTHLTLQTKRIV